MMIQPCRCRALGGAVQAVRGAMQQHADGPAKGEVPSCCLESALRILGVPAGSPIWAAERAAAAVSAASGGCASLM
jgi:hypothetical protein